MFQGCCCWTDKDQQQSVLIDAHAAIDSTPERKEGLGGHAGRTAIPKLVYQDREEKDEDALEPPSTFEVVLAKADSEESLGIKLAPLMSCVQVTQVDDDGVVGRFNRSFSFSKRVRIYDLVTEVNGHTERRGMLHALVGDIMIRLKIERPEEFVAFINKQGQIMGLELLQLAGSVCLVVQSVRTGAVGEYNQTAPEAQQIRGGNLIVSVNQRYGKCEELLQEMGSSDRLELGLLRLNTR